MMTMLDELLNEPLNAFLKKAIDDGRVPIGYTCNAVPEVLLSAGNLIPVRVTAPGIAGTENADHYMSRVACSYVRSILEFSLDGRYDFLRGWVFAASCDHLRRLCDNIEYLHKPAFNHIIDTPHAKGPAALAWLKAELGILRGAISDHFGVVIDDDALAGAISDHNRKISVLTKLGEYRLLEAPPFTGGEFHRLMAATSLVPSNNAVELAVNFTLMIEDRKGGVRFRARLLVVGGRIDDPAYIDAIESQGGLVVADRFCTGSMPALAPIETGIDPITAIAAHSFRRTDCPRIMGDFQGRVGRTIDAVKRYRADGVIVEATKFCDMWGVESGAMVKALREAGIPVLRLEHEYRLGAEGQLKTRVQAFIESMGR